MADDERSFDGSIERSGTPDVRVPSGRALGNPVEPRRPISPLRDGTSEAGGDVDPQTIHRLAFAGFAADHSHRGYQPILRTLYALHSQWNRDFFGGELVPPHFLLCETTNPGALGDHSEHSAWGSGSQIRIRPSLLTGTHPLVRSGQRFAEGRLLIVQDVALHETLHQVQVELLKTPEIAYRGHGPRFRDLCNEIGRKLGLPPVRTAKARGRERDLPSCAEWPLCVRPLDYYQGAYLPHEHQKGADAEVESEEATDVPAAPKVLEAWLLKYPTWAGRYRDLGLAVFAELDRFFRTNPAPPSVRKAAVAFLARSYRFPSSRSRGEPGTDVQRISAND